MKKIFALVICVFLALNFAACGLLDSVPDDSSIGNNEAVNGDSSSAVVEDSGI